MVEDLECFDRINLGERLVLDHDEAIAIRLFTALCEIRGASEHCGTITVEIDHDELTMDVDAWAWIEFRRERIWHLGFQIGEICYVAHLPITALHGQPGGRLYRTVGEYGRLRGNRAQ